MAKDSAMFSRDNIFTMALINEYTTLRIDILSLNLYESCGYKTIINSPIINKQQAHEYMCLWNDNNFFLRICSVFKYAVLMSPSLFKRWLGANNDLWC